MSAATTKQKCHPSHLPHSLCADLKHVYLEVAQGDEDTDTSSAVGILVAPETDAIAACRVLTVRAGVAMPAVVSPS